MQYNVTYRKKDKGWQYIISIKKDGRWKYAGSKQGFRTKPLAKLAADERVEEMKKEFEADLSVENRGITFYEFKEKYLNDIRKYREVGTIKIYRQTFNYFSELNNIAMEDIKYLDIQNCVDDMIERGLKIRTIKQHVSRMKTLFDKATKKPYKVLSKTPLDEDIELPEEKEEKEKVKALTKSELESLLSIVKPEKDYIVCLIASSCGLRLGEILGLTWNDIDEERRIMTVNKQWKLLKSGEIGFGPVKRQNSNREVPIPIKTLNELLKYKKDNPTDVYNRIILDKDIYATSKRINPKLKRYGYDVCIHDLRHTYATTLVAHGIDFKTIAKLMGHDVEQTIKTYSHVTDDMIKNATNVLNSVF